MSCTEHITLRINPITGTQNISQTTTSFIAYVTCVVTSVVSDENSTDIISFLSSSSHSVTLFVPHLYLLPTLLPY